MFLTEVSTLRRVTILFGALFLGLFTIAIVVVLGMRARSPRVIDAVRRFARDVGNPWQMRTAGSQGAYASVIRHVGRTSGRSYETPVGAVGTDDGFVIALPYGSHADWLKNVLAAGSATIVHEGHTYRVDQPEVVPIGSAQIHFSASDQRSHRLFGVDQCLRVRRVESGEVAS